MTALAAEPAPITVPRILREHRAVVFALEVALSVELPIPSNAHACIVSTPEGDVTFVSFHVESFDALAAWSIYLEEPVTQWAGGFQVEASWIDTVVRVWERA